jgi:CDI immunity protein
VSEDVNEVEILPHKWAEVCYNEKGIFLVTRSGYRMTALDDDGVRHFLPRDASNQTLGAALLDCLTVSRLVPIPEHKAFFDWREADRRYKEHEKWQLRESKTKTLRELRRYQMLCSVSVVESEIKMYPRNHFKINEWAYFIHNEVEPVRIPFASPAAEIGAALREAMNRCTGLGREEAQLPEPLPD